MNGYNVPDNDSIIRDWLLYAGNDYNSAYSLMYITEIRPVPYNTICHLCHQSSELAVKALVHSLGARGGVPKSHDIRMLFGQIANIMRDEYGIAIPDEMISCASYLVNISSDSRYPNPAGINIDRDKAEKSLIYAKKIIDWVKEQIIIIKNNG